MLNLEQKKWFASIRQDNNANHVVQLLNNEQLSKGILNE